MEDGARWVAVVVALAMVAVPTAAWDNGQRTHDPYEECRDRLDARLEALARRSPRTVATLRERLADRCEPGDRSEHVAACRQAIRDWHREAEQLQEEHAREWQAFHNDTRTQMRDLVEDGNVTWDQVRAVHRERAEQARELMEEHRREWHEHAQDHPARDECLPSHAGSPDDPRSEPHPCVRDRSGDASQRCRDAHARSYAPACPWPGC